MRNELGIVERKRSDKNREEDGERKRERETVTGVRNGTRYIV